MTKVNNSPLLFMRKQGLNAFDKWLVGNGPSERHLKLTLIQDPDGGGYPRLFVELTPKFTKRYLGLKDMYVSFLRL